MCQICGKSGHIALDCWYRHDTTYQSTSPTTPKAYTAAVSSSPTDSPMSTVPPWYIDSVATNHLTPDLTNFQQYQAYQGSDQVQVGNCSGLPIQHVGNGILPTPHFSFLLSNLLHVPSISSNLRSDTM